MKEWKTIKLGKLLTESKLESTSPNTNRRIRVKLNVGGVEKRPDTNDKEGATKYFTRKAGQFIYGKQNLHKGAFGIIPIELDGYESSSDIPAFDVDDSCYPEWIFYFFKQGNFYLKLESLAKGVGSKRIQPSQLFDLNISLPSKIEQKIILESVESFDQRYNKLNHELDYQFDLISKLKSKTLQDAIEGALTEEWRKKNSNKYTSESLLKILRAEKDQLSKSRARSKEKPLSKIKKSDLPFEIPESWCWIRLGDIIKENPRNGYSPQSVNYETNVKSLKLGATTKGYFDSNEFKYLDVEIPSDSYLWLEPGDILIQRSNSIEYVGISAIYTGDSKEYIYPDLMMKIQALENIEIDYLYRVLSSSYIRNYFRANATGTSGSMPKINQSVVLNALISLPSREEQLVIVDKLKQFYDHYLNLEKQVNESRKDLEQLYHKTLSDVFGDKNTDLVKKPSEEVKSDFISILPLRLMNSYTLKNYKSTMELEQLLKQNGKMSAISLWKMSKFENDIDAFYEELKKLVEEKKAIKECKEKGFLELVK